MYLLLLFWDDDMFSCSNIDPTLSTLTIMGCSKTTPVSNKNAWENSILQHISVVSEYSDSVIDNATIL